jgi:kelch-like protein 2/3
MLLRGINSQVLTQILDYVYTGQVDINRDNVYDLFVTSDYLSLLCLREVCCDFLNEKLDVEMCIGDMLFAR